MAFRMCLTLDVKIVWFGGQVVAVCVNKRHKMQVLGVVGFKSSTLTVYWKAPDFFTKNWKYIQLCVSFLDSFIYNIFRDLSLFHPLFGLKSKIMTLCQKCKKKKKRSLPCYTTFSWCWKVEKKTKNIHEGHTKFLVCTACRLNILKYPPEAAKVATSVKFLNFGKT